MHRFERLVSVREGEERMQKVSNPAEKKGLEKITSTTVNNCETIVKTTTMPDLKSLFDMPFWRAVPLSTPPSVRTAAPR